MIILFIEKKPFYIKQYILSTMKQLHPQIQYQISLLDAQHQLVRRVDDGVHRQRRDVALDDSNHGFPPQ